MPTITTTTTTQDGPPISLAIWERQCTFYEALWAEMKAEQSTLREDMRAEQSAIRRDITYGLAEIKRELEKYRGDRVEAHAHVDMQPLLECVRTEVRDAMAEANMQKIEVKPELNLKPIEDRIARMELKSDTSSTKLSQAIDKLDSSIADVSKKQPDYVAMQARIAKIEKAVVNVAESMASDLQKCQTSIVKGIAEQVAKIEKAVVNVAESVASDLQKCQTSIVKGIAVVDSKQDEVARAFSTSKLHIDVAPLVDFQPLMDVSERIDRQMAIVNSKQDEVASAVREFSTSKLHIDVAPLVNFKPLMDVTERIDRHTTDISDEVAKIAAAQLEHKYAIEKTSQVDLKPMYYTLAKLEQKVDKIQPTSVTVTGPGALQEYVKVDKIQPTSVTVTGPGSLQEYVVRSSLENTASLPSKYGS